MWRNDLLPGQKLMPEQASFIAQLGDGFDKVQDQYWR
jgi:hypothetical protein